MQEIRQSIFYENVYPGVVLGAIFCTQGTVLIDAPLRGEDARSWLSIILNLSENSNRVLINLDAHPDRTLGARSMDCTIIAHQKTAQVFRGRPSVFKGQNADSGSEWETFDDVVGTRWALPDITFTHKLSLHWGGSEIIFDHHPGPAPGAIWVVIPSEKTIFVGDAVLENQPPFLTHADIPAWLETLDILKASYRDYLIISGRSGPVAMNIVRQQQEQLKSIMKGLEKLSKHNANPEDVENLIPKLISGLDFPAELMEQYVQRFRHGLIQYYTLRYSSPELLNE